MKQILLAGVVFLIIFGLSTWASYSLYIPAPANPAPAAQEPPPVTESSIPFEPWQQDEAVFQKGRHLAVASSPDYEKALQCFNDNIKAFPKAGDLDYSYGWAAICLAKMGRFTECLEYYRILRERFYGTCKGGAAGALRNWDFRLKEIRELAEKASGSVALECLRKMRELDEWALKKFGPSPESLQSPGQASEVNPIEARPEKK